MGNKTKQVDWVANYLRRHGSITQPELDAFYGANGNSSLSARIGELRGAGWNISKADGVYTLVSEPLPFPPPPVNTVQIARSDLELIQQQMSELQSRLFDILANN